VRERIRAGVPDEGRPALDLELDVLAQAIRAGEGSERIWLAERADPRDTERELSARHAAASAEDLEVVLWRLGLQLTRDTERAFESRFASGPVDRVLCESYFEG